MAMANAKPLDLAAVREKLAQTGGQEYWRSLQELAETPGFDKMLEREFPNQAPASWAALSRRDFMKLMGASLALAGLSGCARQPQEDIIAYVDQPEHMVMGKPLFYATASTQGGYATGVLVESNQGRPTKVEGNPQHPISRGATDLWMQASVLNLWDPDRSQTVIQKGEISTWDEYAGAMHAVAKKLRATRGQGFRILTGAFSSPTLQDQMNSLLSALPNAKWHTWEPVSQDNVHAGARMAFGRPLQPIYDFTKADIVVGLDADFLLDDPNRLRYSRDFIKNRRVRDGLTSMSRFYAFESTPTITGAKADHRRPVRASQVEGIARAIAAKLGVSGFAGQTLPAGIDAKFVDTLIADLQAKRGRSLVTVGGHQPAVVHAIAHAINEALGNSGVTVSFIAPAEAMPAGAPTKLDSLRALVNDMNAGQVETLLILGSNPVYTAPADLKFADALKKVKLRVHSGSHRDETAEWSHWHIPQAHYLESWSDARAIDGTISLVQPLIAPLYQAWTLHEQLSLFNGGQLTSYEIVKNYWRRQRPAGDFEKFWQTALHDGVIANTALPAVAARVVPGRIPPAAPAPNAAGLEVLFRADPTIWDGTYSNNGWLQECPKPLSKLTWDNTAQISPATGQKLGVENEGVIEIRLGSATVLAPVWLLPGHPDDAVTLHMGYGRTKAGQLADGIGFNANLLRTTGGINFATGATATVTGEKVLLATTQIHHSMHGRDFVREASLEYYLEHPGFAQGPVHGQGDGRQGPINAIGAQRMDGKAEILPPRGADGHGAHGGGHGEDKGHGGGHGGGHGDDHGKGGHDTGHAPPKLPHEIHAETRNEGRASGDDVRHGPEYDAPGRVQKPIKGIEDHPSIYPEWHYKGYAWGMVIDQTACIGCNACVVGCVSENNVATVGKDEVLRGRHMQWLRMDTYFRGDIDNPETSFQPVMCMHCENAPCEPVCPVEATSHSSEGINEMTYNRCVGTRYCSNNCPYKVRRFNFLQYSEQDSPTIMLGHNPDVTVRARGVMEKCTYCVQRVTQARIEADKDDRVLRDGEVITACQQACPTSAIIFGDLNDPNSRVSQMKQKKLNYGLLTELNTQPRTTYLAKIQNPNTALKAANTRLGDTPETPWEASR